MKIGLIVEGNSDKILFSSLEKWFKERKIDIEIIESGGKSRMKKNFHKHLKTCKYLLQTEYVIFLPDQDGDSTIEDTISSFPVARDFNYSISVLAKELEAWILSDSTCLNLSFGINRAPAGYTDNIVNPKEVLISLVMKTLKHEITNIEIINILKTTFSLNKAKQNNNSARNFVDLIESLSLAQQSAG